MDEKKKLLIVVPHEDDELILAGPFWDVMMENYEVFVLFTTNGDYGIRTEKNSRLEETLSALNVMGVKESNVIFLGYGDKWNNYHLYNSRNDEVRESACGRNKTYALDSHQDFHFQKKGEHAQYTKHNFQMDLYEAIEGIMPSVILCCDLDDHPDHIATSICTEEAIGTLLLTHKDYYPLVLKKFAYSGSWFGNSDYWLYKPTILEGVNNRFSCIESVLDNPFYNLNEALVVNSSPSIFTKKLSESPLYLAALKYRSQPLALRMPKVLNSNSLFWERRTDNLLRKAKISATSGEVAYLNDFKILDCKNANLGDYPSFCDIGWIPDKNDTEKKITILFDDKVSIGKISIYNMISEKSCVNKCKVEVSGNCFVVDFDGYKRCDLILDNKLIDIDRICISIVEYSGDYPGISEIEVFDAVESKRQLFKTSGMLVEHESDSKKNTILSMAYSFVYLCRFKSYYGIRKIRMKLEQIAKSVNNR